MLKKVLIGLVAILALFALTACADGDDDPTPPGPGAPTPTPADPGDPTPTPTPVANDRPGEGMTVRSTLPTWNTEYVAGEIVHIALEELGYTVEEVGDRSLDNPVIFTDMGAGNIDIFPNYWRPIHDPQVAEVPEGAGDLNLVGVWAAAGALQGFLIDRATAEEHNITSLADFADPDIRALYDQNGDGMAEMVGCPPGWGCRDHIAFLWDQYGLGEYITRIGDDVEVDYAPAMADLVSRYQAGEPVFFYTWTPNWTVYQLVPGEDVVWIEVPDPVEDSLTDDDLAAGFTADDLRVDGVEGCVNDPCAMGFVGADLGTLANQNFLNDNPAAARLLEVIEIPLDFVFEQNNIMFEDGEDSFADIRRHAEEWVENNRSTVDSWLDEARQAAAN